MALAAEAGARVDERHGGAEAVELVGVDAGGDVALEDPEPELLAERGDGALEQRGLAGAGRRHEVDGRHTGRRRSRPGCGRRCGRSRRGCVSSTATRSAPGVGVAAVVADVTMRVLVS